ncbi:MAG: hypothetical protein IKV59_00055 [Lachnospiraceae bacterium]|nr:hypothetical protein [Lachnospiraceae bacterium]
MQQRQSKSASETKKKSSISKIMLQRDKDRWKSQQKQAYIDELKEPRSKEYLRLLAKSSELCEQLTDIEEEIEQLQQEIEREVRQETASLPVSDACEEVQTKRSSPAWMKAGGNTVNVLQKIQDKQQKLLQMERQRNELAEEFQAVQKAFIEQLPVPDKLIGMIYPDWSIDILMQYGVIACPGTSFSSPQELIAQVKPRTKEEEQAWLKGNEVYQTYYCEELLIVEIYIDAACVVYKDGTTKVVE